MADVELNSIGNGDGTNYLLRDNTKIPLSGSNAISGSLIPATDNSYNLGSNTNSFSNAYINWLKLSGPNITRTVDNDTLSLFGGTGYNYGALLALYGKDSTINAGAFRLRANDGTNSKELIGKPDGTLSWSGSSFILSGYDPYIKINKDDEQLALCGGSGWEGGGLVGVSGKDKIGGNGNGCVYFIPCTSNKQKSYMFLQGNGTWNWTGTAVQLVSDQRLKQQITEIDDKLLDAWEDVEPVQFKYNDAVKEKSDNARLHTGYVVQQIDDACKKHNVDVSKYGLYCHEEYEEETREVEHEDGTKTTEVVRPASEHYSLRYTEALIVECAYLRKKNKDLQEQLNALSERLEKLENR